MSYQQRVVSRRESDKSDKRNFSQHSHSQPASATENKKSSVKTASKRKYGEDSTHLSDIKIANKTENIRSKTQVDDSNIDPSPRSMVTEAGGVRSKEEQLSTPDESYNLIPLDNDRTGDTAGPSNFRRVEQKPRTSLDQRDEMDIYYDNLEMSNSREKTYSLFFQPGSSTERTWHEKIKNLFSEKIKATPYSESPLTVHLYFHSNILEEYNRLKQELGKYGKITSEKQMHDVPVQSSNSGQGMFDTDPTSELKQEMGIKESVPQNFSSRHIGAPAMDMDDTPGTDYVPLPTTPRSGPTDYEYGHPFQKPTYSRDPLVSTTAERDMEQSPSRRNQPIPLEYQELSQCINTFRHDTVRSVHGIWNKLENKISEILPGYTTINPGPHKRHHDNRY